MMVVILIVDVTTHKQVPSAVLLGKHISSLIDFILLYSSFTITWRPSSVVR
jgi:hypothetical protein